MHGNNYYCFITTRKDFSPKMENKLINYKQFPNFQWTTIFQQKVLLIHVTIVCFFVIHDYITQLLMYNIYLPFIQSALFLLKSYFLKYNKGMYPALPCFGFLSTGPKILRIYVWLLAFQTGAFYLGSYFRACFWRWCTSTSGCNHSGKLAVGSHNSVPYFHKKYRFPQV